MEQLKNKKFAVVGLGLHGTRISKTLVEDGYDLVAAVDLAPRVGEPISTFVPGAADAPVVPTIAEALAAADFGFAVLTAAVELPVAVAMAGELLDAGIRVVTIHQDMFEPDTAWSDDLDQRARATGAALLATGVQDTWWVHMIDVGCGSTRNLERIEAVHTLDGETLSVAVANEHGVNLPSSDHEAFLEEWNFFPPTHGSPLRELARKLGLHVTSTKRHTDLAIAAAPVEWKSQNVTVPAGSSTGLTETVTIETSEGVVLRGVFMAGLLKDGETHSDKVRIVGDPELTLDHTPYPGDRITDIAVVNRVPDLLELDPGVHFSADLAAPRYRHKQ